MNSDDEYSLEHQKDKKRKRADTDIEHEQNSQIEERGETSTFALLNFPETMNSEQNSSIQSDSDNEDFSITSKSRKSARPLEDSDSDAMAEEMTAERSQTAFPNNGDAHLHLPNTIEKDDTKWDSDCSDGQSEKCPICLSKFHGQEIGTPESCDHSFCLECLLEWEKKVNTCPVDRLPFLLILVRQKLDGKIKRRIPVSSHKSTDTWFEQDNDGEEGDLTYCEVCGHCDREDRLLLCDSCDLGYHCECLDPPLEIIPVGEWFCPGCDTNKWPEHCMLSIYSNLTEDMLADFREMLRSRFRPGSSVFQHRVIARTLASETVRHRIQRRREAQLENLRNSRGLNEDATVITSVTKRRFAHRLGLQRTAQTVLQPSGFSYSDILALASASYQDDEVSYNSSIDDDDEEDIGYASDRHQPNAVSAFQSIRSPSSSIASNSSRSARNQRIRVPSPPASRGSIDILNTILQTQSLLHSHSQDITIEKDGSLTLKHAGSTQQRPQNPQGRAASSDKYGSLPSASCSSKPTNNEPQIDQWYGLHSSNRQACVSDSYSGNHYDGQHPVHYASSLCDENKKKEHQHPNCTKDAKAQSEDEVDIYSDIESVGDEIIDEVPDVPNNEHCNITNVYRSDLQLDTMEEDSDSSENELVIDEDAKVEEEDSHGEQWNENFNAHCFQEESDHNNSSPSKGSNYNNFTLQEESNHGTLSPQEESNPNFSLQESSCNNSLQEESVDFSFKQENKSEVDTVASPCNTYQEFVNNEAVDILSQNVCEPKSCDTANSEASAEEIMDYNDEGHGGNEDDELSDNYNDTLSNVQENEGSSDEDPANKTINEESLSPPNENITSPSETATGVEVSVISKQRTSFTQHDSLCMSAECGEYIPKVENIEEYNYEQETNIILDDQINLQKGDSEVFSNVTEENSVCSSPLDDRSLCMEEENESQESDAKSNSGKEEMVITFSKTIVSDLCIDSDDHSGNEKPDDEGIKHSNDMHQNSSACDQEDSSKFTEVHRSIMPAEDVEDISEAGSDDIKFKDGIEDWDIEVAENINNKQVENLRDEETDEREIDVDDVEQRVAKLFADEDLSPPHGNVSNLLVKTSRTCTEEHRFVNRTTTLEEEREEGEIIEEASPKRHKSRSRKSHHRESVHHRHDDIEEYSDLPPRVNISDLPKIPKLKKDKTKVENQEEMLPTSKRTSVLSRIDIGVSSEISWKRLSKSTRERSYRDGRPKDDRLLFADREIKQKMKKDEGHQRKDDDRHKEDRHKRAENEKWRDKSDREHSKDRNDKQRESSRDKSEKRLEKEWRSEKSRDKKDEKEKLFDKFHHEEKSHRDKHKHKHKEKDVNKDHKSDKDKTLEKEKHSYLHHSHEREHSKQKDRKPKQTETKFKEAISKKEAKKEKAEKPQDRKGAKHDRKRHDESHRHYEHKKKDELRYPAITAIESKEIYTKGDSIIINVNFNRSAEKELAIEEEKSVQKDVKRTKLKDKGTNDRRFEKADMKYSKQKHSSHLIDQAEINLSKQSPSERCEQKKSTEKVQIGEMLWKETEDNIEDRLNMQTNDDIEDRLDDSDQLSNFKSHSSPASCVSEQSEKMNDIITKDVKNKTLLSPYNEENDGSQNSVLCSSPIRRSPRSPSPPSPTENDSYDPCDPTASPFLQEGSPLSPENTLSSLEGRPVPPPSPELPPLPLEPEPVTQDKCISADDILEKTSNPNLISSSDSVQITSTCSPISSTSLAQMSHFSLPNVKVPPPNYTHKLSSGIGMPNSNIQISSPTVPNWNSGNVQVLFATRGGQPSVQGCYIPSHLTQGAITASQPGAFAQTSVAAVPQNLIHSSGQSAPFMTTLPDVRVPPPQPQMSLNLSQQSHTPQPIATSSAVGKSSPDVVDVVDMEVESPYTPGDSPVSSDKSVSQKQPSVPTKDKFDILLSSLIKEHYCSPAASGSSKRHRDDVRLLAEKVKESQLFSKSVISVLDKMNKKLLASKKLQQSCSSAKRSKIESKLLDPNRNRHNRMDSAKSSSKKELKQEKKEVINRTGEAQKTAVDDLPSSAVEMQFLKKLNRQERVVEEVKLCLKPYYSRREINKEEYKEIMRKSVPKVCHNRSGDINPVKIKTLIEGYIRKFKHHRKKASKMQKAKIS